jgi:hypothetical protein
VLELLSPTSRKVVELYENPPRALLDELQALRARSEYGRERGIPSVSPKDITFGMIFDLMGCSRRERKAVYDELKLLARKVNQ